MSEYSVEEVRRSAQFVKDMQSHLGAFRDDEDADEAALWDGHDAAANMLRAYADLREQIERAREGVTDEVVAIAEKAYDAEINKANTDVSAQCGEASRDLSVDYAIRAALQSVAHLLPSGERGGVDEDTFVQPVPDHCDRIVWRGKYYGLAALAQPAQVAGVDGLALSQSFVDRVTSSDGDEPSVMGAAHLATFTEAQVDWLMAFNARLIVDGLHPEDARLWMRANDEWDFAADPVAEADCTWQDFFANPDDDGPVGQAPTAEPVAQGEAVDVKQTAEYSYGYQQALQDVAAQPASPEQPAGRQGEDECLSCGAPTDPDYGHVGECTHPAAPVGVPDGCDVVVDPQGVRFGKNCWMSHEKITGRSAESLNNGGGVIGPAYMEWVRAMLAAAPSAPQEQKVCTRNCDCVGPCKMGDE